MKGFLNGCGYGRCPASFGAGTVLVERHCSSRAALFKSSGIVQVERHFKSNGTVQGEWQHSS
jgi:hypothetical protein